MARKRRTNDNQTAIRRTVPIVVPSFHVLHLRE
nr:MAG TPA: hypothetical protein [Caudoviricetes sp.]